MNGAENRSSDAVARMGLAYLRKGVALARVPVCNELFVTKGFLMLFLLLACATCVQINLDQLGSFARPETPWQIVSRAAGLVADEAQRLKDAGCPDANGCRAEDYHRVLVVQGELDQASRKAFYARPAEVDAHLAMLDREGDLLRRLSRCELGDVPKPPDLAAELEGISSNLSRDREVVTRAAALP